MASVTREVIAAIQSRAAVERSRRALVPPCLTSSMGALPRLLSIRSGRGGPAAGDRE